MVEEIPMAESSGYAHPGYVASLSEFGSPTLLPRSGAWALKRRIPGTSQYDLMGPYPLFFCRDWSGLPEDLAGLAGEAVSFAMVTDPFAKLRPEFLKSTFDVAIPFKNHFITELSRPLEAIVSKSHRDTVRRSLKKIEVSICPDPPSRLAEWTELFGHLVKRHRICGIRAFSEHAFFRQLSIPGIVLFEAREIATGDFVGMDIWYLQHHIAYGHLAAFSERGYALRASYATKWRALGYFSGKVKYAHLGAAPGVGGEAGAADGLARFKQGWSTGVLQNYFCGKVLHPAAYARLVCGSQTEGISFFPAYRQGEFSL
jgi:hypothetical protein